MEWATPVDHRLGYGEFLQERPRAYEENEDRLLQGLTYGPPSPLASLVPECLRTRCGRSCELVTCYVIYSIVIQNVKSCDSPCSLALYAEGIFC